MNGAKQINCLSCPYCNRTGTAIWMLHVRPRKLQDLAEFSEGFRCIDHGDGRDPYFQCAGCRLEAIEREPNSPVAQIIATLAHANDAFSEHETDDLHGG